MVLSKIDVKFYAVFLVAAGIALSDSYLTVLGFLTILFFFNHAAYRALSDELEELKEAVKK